MNLREMMYPFTAMKLKESGKAKIKEILHTTKNFGVTNLLMLNSKGKRNILKMAHIPDGPTFTFEIKSFNLNRDLQALIPRNKNVQLTHLGAPLAIIKGFNADNAKIDKRNLHLMNSMFNNMFPKLSYFNKVNAGTFKRAILFYYDSEKNTVEIRNYYIKRAFTGLNKNIKKILNANKIPDFSQMEDVADLFAKDDVILSDSDIDALPNNKVEIEDKVLGKKDKQQVNIRLYETGPRLTLKLIKIEEEFLKGEVLYHALVEKTEEEKEALKKNIIEKEDTKFKNKKVQEENVKRKAELKEEQLLKKRSKNPTNKDAQEAEKKEEDEDYDFLV